jgi:hypothetical protein
MILDTEMLVIATIVVLGYINFAPCFDIYYIYIYFYLFYYYYYYFLVGTIYKGNMSICLFCVNSFYKLLFTSDYIHSGGGPTLSV